MAAVGTLVLETMYQFNDIARAFLVAMASQMLKDPKFVFRFGCPCYADLDRDISTLPEKDVSKCTPALTKTNGLGVPCEPYGRKRAITKFSKDLIPVAIEGIAEMDGMETARAIALDPLCCGMDLMKPPLG
jgi:hypothetical protein